MSKIRQFAKQIFVLHYLIGGVRDDIAKILTNNYT